MQTYLVRCRYEPDARAQFLVHAEDPKDAEAKATHTPLYRTLFMQVDDVIDESLLCWHLRLPELKYPSD